MDISQELDLARRAYSAGKWTIGELTCRNILATDPACAPALELLGIIAVRAGAAEQADKYFEEARMHAPVSGGFSHKLRLAGTAIQRKILFATMASKRGVDATAKDRYLIIKSWGYGFWSDMSHVLGGLLLAEITGRTPVIHWGKNCRFGDGSARDAFQNYFEQVSDLSILDIARIKDVTFFPPKWTRANLTEENLAKWNGEGSRLGAVEFLNRPEMVAVADFYIGIVNTTPWLPAHHPMRDKPIEKIYSYLFKKYLRPQADVDSRCDSFQDRYLADAPFVAVHVRGSDKAQEETTLDATNQKIQDALASISEDFRIFLLTDDENLYSLMKEKYGARMVATQCQRTSTTTGTHYLPSIDRIQAGLEMMTDTYLALRADKFIGNGRSNVSAMIAVMRDWNPGDCMLMGTSQITMLNLPTYRASGPSKRAGA